MAAHQLMPDLSPDALDARDVRAVVAVSRYNARITGALLEGARAEFDRLHGLAQNLAVVHAPGAFELPAILAAALRSGRFDCAVALGCVIRGETTHDRHISDAVAAALAHLSVQAGAPVAFGVLTVQSEQQALERAGGSKGNKGAEAMRAAIETLDAIRRLGGDR